MDYTTFSESVISIVTGSMSSFATTCAETVVDVFNRVAFVAGSDGLLSEVSPFLTYGLIFVGVGFVTTVCGSILYKIG